MEYKEYAKRISKDGLFWLLEDNVLVMRDMNKWGHPVRKAVVLTPRTFCVTGDSHRQVTMLLCSCNDNIHEHELVDAAPPFFDSLEELMYFRRKRDEKACVHTKVALQRELIIQDNVSYCNIINVNVNYGGGIKMKEKP